IDVRVNARAELAPRDALDLGVAVSVSPPAKIVSTDADRREDPFEQEILEIALVGERDALREPVRPAVAIGPSRPRREKELLIPPGFAKSRRVGREVAERDALDPALLLARVVRVGGRAEARVKAMSEIVETELPVGDRESEGGDADRLRRRLQIVALREISPVEDDASMARDDPGA